MNKIIETKNIYGGFKMNKSMLFTSALGISMLDNVLSRVFNSISNVMLVNNDSPKYSENLFDVSSPLLRVGNSYNKSGINYW